MVRGVVDGSGRRVCVFACVRGGRDNVTAGGERRVGPGDCILSGRSLPHLRLPPRAACPLCGWPWSQMPLTSALTLACPSTCLARPRPHRPWAAASSRSRRSARASAGSERCCARWSEDDATPANGRQIATSTELEGERLRALRASFLTVTQVQYKSPQPTPRPATLACPVRSTCGDASPAIPYTASPTRPFL